MRRATNIRAETRERFSDAADEKAVRAKPIRIRVPAEEDLGFCGYLRQLAIDTLSAHAYGPPPGSVSTMEGQGSGERIIAHLGFARAVAVVGLVQAGCEIRRLRTLPGDGRTLPASAAGAHVHEVFLRLDHCRRLERVVCCRRAAIPMAQPVHESGDERPNDDGDQGERPQLFHGPQPTARMCVTSVDGMP